MTLRWNPREHWALWGYVAKWIAIVTPVGLAVGSACAIFLWSLERVTELRWGYPWLLFLLPLGGIAIGLLYHWLGRAVEGGTDLVMEEIHEPGGGVPGGWPRWCSSARWSRTSSAARRAARAPRCRWAAAWPASSGGGCKRLVG